MPGSGCCTVCAQRKAGNGTCPNELCRSPRRRIARIHAIGYQSGALRRAINDYKYREARDWSSVFGRLLVAWLHENMTDDPPGLIVANPSFVGAGGQEFAHTEAVLRAAAGASPGNQWPFDLATPAAIVKTEPTLKSADAQAWSKRVVGYELRAALQVPAGPRRRPVRPRLRRHLHDRNAARRGRRLPTRSRRGPRRGCRPRARPVARLEGRCPKASSLVRAPGWNVLAVTGARGHALGQSGSPAVRAPSCARRGRREPCRAG